MALARRKKKLTDQNGNVLPLSVHEAVETIRDLGAKPFDESLYGEDEKSEWPSRNGKQRYVWARYGDFSRDLSAVGSLTLYRNMPKPRTIAKAVRDGHLPGLTAESLREAIALLTRYAEALEEQRT
jgi:hypothetical protein